MMAPLSREFLGTLLVLISAVSFGLMPIFAVFAYRDDVSVGELLFLRFLFASIIMGALLVLSGRFVRPNRTQIFTLLALGGIAYFLQATLYFTSLVYIPVSLVALILYSYPAFVTAGSISLGWERPSRRILASLLLALAGLLLVTNAGGNFAVFGVLLAVGAAFTYSIYILASSRALKRMSGEAGIFYVMAGAAVSFALLVSLTGDFRFEWKPGAWTWIILVTLVCTCLAATTFFQGLKLIGPTRASILSVMEPITSILVASIVFPALLKVQQWLGGVIIILAVLLAATAKTNPSSR